MTDKEHATTAKPASWGKTRLRLFGQSHVGKVRLRLFGQSHVGKVREHNEDSFLIADLTTRRHLVPKVTERRGLGSNGYALSVCDGMGGAAAGEVASRLAVDTIYEQLTAHPPASSDTSKPSETAQVLLDAVQVAGERIYESASENRDHQGMGTTATVATVTPQRMYVAQVGDSRAYLLRGEALVQVSRDQSLVNQLIEDGHLTEEEAKHFEHNNVILQALGTSDTVEVDITHIDLKHLDRIMLCSDGLSSLLRHDEIRRIMLTHDDPRKACQLLIDEALAAGGYDNITVIIGCLEGSQLPTASPGEVPSYERLEHSSTSQRIAPAQLPALPTEELSSETANNAERLNEAVGQARHPTPLRPRRAPGTQAALQAKMSPALTGFIVLVVLLAVATVGFLLIP